MSTEELQRQKRAVEEQLRGLPSFRGRGRGRGRGIGRGVPFDRTEDEPLPSIPDGTERAVQSAIVASGENDKEVQEDSRERRRKRVQSLTEDAQVTKRSRKLFGVLVGTLKSFQAKTKAELESEKAKRRAEIEKKAEEKDLEERERLKEENRKERQEQRERERKIKERLLRKYAEVEAKITIACWDAQKKTTANFLRTKTEPPLCYLPVKVDSDMRQIIESQKARSEEEVEAAGSVEDRQKDLQAEIFGVTREELEDALKEDETAGDETIEMEKEDGTHVEDEETQRVDEESHKANEDNEHEAEREAGKAREITSPEEGKVEGEENQRGDQTN